MRWSCNKQAGDTMERITDTIVRHFDNQNQWRDKQGNTYFWEIGREHEDGHISGTVWHIIPIGRYKDHCKKVGSIYINPDGSIRRIPSSLRQLLK